MSLSADCDICGKDCGETICRACYEEMESEVKSLTAKVASLDEEYRELENEFADLQEKLEDQEAVKSQRSNLVGRLGARIFK